MYYIYKGAVLLASVPWLFQVNLPLVPASRALLTETLPAHSTLTQLLVPGHRDALVVF